jgi:hypothetical protein
MTKKKAVILLVIAILILVLFVILASIGGKKVVSPVPEEPKIIWIKPSLSPTPTILPSPSGQTQRSAPTSKPKIVPTVVASPVPTTTP